MGKIFTRPDGRRAGKPTFWGGRWYRSRLESEWAECWDAWGVVYLYESHRFQFEDGTFLPDFELPALGAWVEVKPAPATVHEAWLCKRLALHTSCPVYLAVGHPWVAEVAVCDSGGWRPAERRELFGGKGDADV